MRPAAPGSTAEGSDGPKPPGGRLVIFTDLDGTILDHDTYSWAEATDALDICRRCKVPIIMASSKTWAELAAFCEELEINHPYISENGGGVYFPADGPIQPPAEARLEGGLWRWSLGPEYASLTRALDEIAAELGLDIVGFSKMSLEEIIAATGLDRGSARLAALREFDEPFMFRGPEPADPGPLREAARRRGLMVTQGGRFWHLQGPHDKGAAVRELLGWYRSLWPGVRSAALGDSPNDFSMLEAVDHPILIRSNRRHPEFEASLPGLKITEEKGPKGWNKAVKELLEAERAM